MRALVTLSILVMAVAHSAAAEPVDVRARAAYARGKAAYQRGSYAEALQHFETAYQVTRAPALLFNMAQAQRLSGPDHCRPALDLYQRYLAEDPEASNREEAAERVGEMRACVESARALAEKNTAPEQATSLPVASDAPESVPPQRTPDLLSSSAPSARVEPRGGASPTAAILLTGAGVTLGVAGAILYLSARAKYENVEASCPCEPGTFSKWETLTHVSYGLMAAGAVGTGSGISWLVLGGDGDRPKVHGLLLSGAARF